MDDRRAQYLERRHRPPTRPRPPIAIGTSDEHGRRHRPRRFRRSVGGHRRVPLRRSRPATPITRDQPRQRSVTGVRDRPTAPHPRARPTRSSCTSTTVFEIADLVERRRSPSTITPVDVTTDDALAPGGPRAAARPGWRQPRPSARTSWSTRTPCGASPAWPGSGLATGSSRSAPDSARSPSPWPRRAPTVTAVEVDRGLVPPCCARSVADVPACAWWRATPAAGLGRRCSATTGGWVLVANLPYNVATPLVADLLDGVPAMARMLVMVQREVGERLAAGPGDDAYGAVVGEGGLLGRRPSRRAVPPPCSCPGRRSSRRWWRSRAATAGRRRRPPERAVRPGAGRLRPAPQDAAPLAGRRRRRRRVRGRRGRARRPGPRSSASRSGAAGRAAVGVTADARARRPS